jgi:hypothetical protein
VEDQPFGLSHTDGFSCAQLFETFNEIVGQISTILPEAFLRRSHQMETRCGASIPLVDGHQTSAVIAAVKGFEAQAHEFWRVVNEISHSQRIPEFLNSCSWHNGGECLLVALLPLSAPGRHGCYLG